MNLDLIEEAFSRQENYFDEVILLPFSRPLTLAHHHRREQFVSPNVATFTFFLPSMWHLFSQTLANISSANDSSRICDIMSSYIKELDNVLSLSDKNFIVLPRIPDEVLFGITMGGSEYKSFLSWKKIWLKFAEKLTSAFENNIDVVILDAMDLFGPPEKQNRKLRQRLFFELMVEHTLEEADSFSENAILSVKRHTKVSHVKCICLDLDNTLWGGILGDVGISGITLGGLSAKGRAFVEIQKFFKNLKNRGIFLAIVSKNYTEIVQKALDEHPDMILRREDFQIIYCGWGAKSNRIKTIAKSLNISEESIVFFDDSPLERNEVRQNAPRVIVPDYSSNPFECLASLYTSNIFFTPVVSSDDFLRNSSIALRDKNIHGDGFDATLNANRANVKGEEDSVAIVFENVTDQNRPRILQLMNKTNQFNLTGNHYHEKSLSSLLAECDISFVGNVKDKFATYGLTVILFAKVCGPTINVKEFVMSCRVFGRGVEIAAVEKLIGCCSTDIQKIDTIKFMGNKTGKNLALLDFLDHLKLHIFNCPTASNMKFLAEIRDSDE